MRNHTFSSHLSPQWPVPSKSRQCWRVSRCVFIMNGEDMLAASSISVPEHSPLLSGPASLFPFPVGLFGLPYWSKLKYCKSAYKAAKSFIFRKALLLGNPGHQHFFSCCCLNASVLLQIWFMEVNSVDFFDLLEKASKNWAHKINIPCERRGGFSFKAADNDLLSIWWGSFWKLVHPPPQKMLGIGQLLYDRASALLQKVPGSGCNPNLELGQHW